MAERALPWQAVAAQKRQIINWRNIAGAAITLIFVSLVLITSQAASRRPSLGLSFVEERTAAVWVVSTVTPTSPAAEAGARVGDVLVALNGIATRDIEALGASDIDSATQVALRNPATGREIVIGTPGQQIHAPNTIPFLFIAFIFFAVGLVALLSGHGPAPRALILLCFTGAVETLSIPLGSRQIVWALALNGLGAPIFIGGFAFLFMVFPV